jgi:hypothetical protein
MKLCICGIGGAGGKIARNFLEDTGLISRFMSWITGGKYVSPGRAMGIWIEADKDDAKNKQIFFKDLTEGGHPGFFIPTDSVPVACELHKAIRGKYGYDVKKHGFVRDAQYLKAIFEIFDSDREIQSIAADMALTGPNVGILGPDRSKSPIFDSAWKAIEPYTILGGGECDALLFIISFGGRTGTGFINPIVAHIRKSGNTDIPIFVLGVLTEPGDGIYGGCPSFEGPRYLAAISALYDLLANRNGANGIMLIDNAILEKLAGLDRQSQNRIIYYVMKAMVIDHDYPGEDVVSHALGKDFSMDLKWPPIFVPAYWSLPKRESNEEDLVKMAITEGKLFDCSPIKADKAFVFCRGPVDPAKIEKALSQEGIKNVRTYRKMGGKDREVLILLRNPYGGDPQAYKTEGTLENKLCMVISSALNYMNMDVEDLFYEDKFSKKLAETEDEVAIKLTALSKDALSHFFFGREGYIKDDIGRTEGFAFELREATSRLKLGKNPIEEPMFTKPLRIFKRDE